MKNILVAAIFLFSQVGFAAEKVNEVKTKKFQIENMTFSQLLLTKEEIIHLSKDDQLKYMFSMIALAQIVESAQWSKVSYVDQEATGNRKTSSVDSYSSSSRYTKIFATLFPEANAFGPLLAAAVRLGLTPVLEATASFVGRRAASVAAARSVIVAEKAAQAAIEPLKKVAIENAKKLSVAQASYAKALVKNPALSIQSSEAVAFREASRVVQADVKAFQAAGGTEAMYSKAISGSGLKNLVMWPFRNWKSLTIGSFAFKGADDMLKEKFGLSIWDAFSGTDISGPAAISEEDFKKMKAGDSSKGVGKGCLFGGHASKYVQQGEQINCTRPAAAENANCLREKGKFQCPTYGITLATGAIHQSLCIETQKIDNLTVRCASILKTTLESTAATLDSDKMIDALQGNFGEVVKALEARDRMQNEQGQTKSIFEYCLADNVEQKEECGAITNVLGFLKTTTVAEIYKGRPPVAAAEASASAPEAPASRASDAPTNQ